MIALLGYAHLRESSQAPSSGWLAPRDGSRCFLVSLVSLCGLIWWERRRREPLLELRFFSSRAVLGAGGVAVVRSPSFGRLPVPEHALSAGYTRRLSSLSRRALHASDRGYDDPPSPRSRTPGGGAATRGCAAPGRLSEMTPRALLLVGPAPATSTAQFARGLRHLRLRLRRPEPADHGRPPSGGHAGRAGRRGRRRSPPPRASSDRPSGWP